MYVSATCKSRVDAPITNFSITNNSKGTISNQFSILKISFIFNANPNS